MTIELKMVEPFGEVYAWSKAGNRTISVVPLTYGRARINLGDDYFVNDCW